LEVEAPNSSSPENKESAANILAEMQKIIRQIYAAKEEAIKTALCTEVCPKCGLRPKTAEWVIPLIWGKPLIEKLNLVCDRGHEWYAGER
jgi:hypothetical protein